MKGAQTVSVFEKDISYGYGGALANDLKAALFDKGLSVTFSSFVAGLGGRDVTPDQIEKSATEVVTNGATYAWINVKGV